MARILSGFTEATQNENLRPVVLEMPDFSMMPDAIRNSSIDGLVIVGQEITPEKADMFHPMPIVWQGGLSLDLPVIDHVHINNRAIGIQAAEYLIDHNLKHLAYLNHDIQHISFPARYAAFKECVNRKKGVDNENKTNNSNTRVSINRHRHSTGQCRL
jgi:DNA-binding LacI/PurR family transcriptional regulator